MKITQETARRGILFPLLLLVVFATFAAPVRASSDAAWAELQKKLDKACLKASDLDTAKIAWSDLYYENHAMALVTGKWKPKHMKGQKAAMLCLYDKKTGRVEVQEFDRALLK